MNYVGKIKLGILNELISKYGNGVWSPCGMILIPHSSSDDDEGYLKLQGAWRREDIIIENSYHNMSPEFIYRKDEDFSDIKYTKVKDFAPLDVWVELYNKTKKK